MTSFLSSFGKLIAGSALFVASLLGYHPAAQPNFGAVVYQPITQFETSLAIAIDNVSTSSLTLVTGVDRNGSPLSGNMCFTLDSGTSLLEYVCGNASGTVVSGLLRGIDPVTGVTSVPGLAHSHRVGTDVKITDSPYLSQWFRLLNGIDGFPNPLQYATSVSNASLTQSNFNLVDYGLLSSTSIQGAVPASYSASGIGLLATTSQLQHGLDGSPTHFFVTSQFVNTLPASNTIPFTNTSGTLPDGFIGQAANDTYNFLGNTTFTGTTTFSNATNSVIITNASGSVVGISTGTLLAGYTQISRNFILFATTTAGGAPTSTYISTTFPAATTSTVFHFDIDINNTNGANSATSTILINGTQLFQCAANFSSPEYNFQFNIRMANSTSSEFMTGVSNGCAKTGAFANNATSSIIVQTLSIPFNTTTTNSILIFGNTQTSANVTTTYSAYSF